MKAPIGVPLTVGEVHTKLFENVPRVDKFASTARGHNIDDESEALSRPL